MVSGGRLQLGVCHVNGDLKTRNSRGDPIVGEAEDANAAQEHVF